MLRTQVQLTEEQVRVLRQIAAQRGVSVSELIREAIERSIQQRNEREKWERLIGVIGRYRSGLSDVSVNHDKYLEEAYLE